ncbi:MAG: SHOCT domain-containing protein [Ruminococcaceae bacterium]|nr:SHOCT domain-containing protein [Oscillospiraceae bacterium]
MNNTTNDQVLIKSEIDKKSKAILFAIFISCLALFAVIFLGLLTIEVEDWSYYGIDMDLAIEAAFDNNETCLVFFILGCTFFLVGVVGAILYWAFSKCELIVTEKNVRGKTFFGKEVVLPLYMVSAYSTRKLFSTIAVATSSGLTKFVLIGNYAAIGEVLGQKINERQESTINETKVQQNTQNSSMDDLLKLKSLLDAGVITQEEFEAKKKQLLGI